MSERIRIAWFSPLSSSAGGETFSAYFTDMLVNELSKEFDIEFFHDSFLGYQDYKTFHFLKAFKRHRDNPFDIFFYQLEDRREADFVRMHLGVKPGVVLFHDFIFRSLGPDPILNSPWQEIVARWNGDRVDWPARDALYDANGPHAMREAAFALVPLFSSERGHSEYLRCVKDKLKFNNSISDWQSLFIPFPVDAGLSALCSEKTGRDLAFCGSTGIEHRAHKVLHALSEVEFPYTFHWLINPSEEETARELLEEFNIDNYRLYAGRTPDKWVELLKGCRIAVHTMFSVYGEPGPYLAMSIVSGKHTVVTNFGSVEYLPDNVVYKVNPGNSEVVTLRELFNELLEPELMPGLKFTSEYGIETYSTSKISDELGYVFNRAAADCSRFMNDWDSFELEARAALFSELKGFLCESDRALLPIDGGWIFNNIMTPAFKELFGVEISEA